MVENAKLRNDIEQLRKQLLDKEKKRGGLLALLPSSDSHHRLNVSLSSKLCDVITLYV